MHTNSTGFNIKKYFEEKAEKKKKEQEQAKKATPKSGEESILGSEMKIEGATEFNFEDLHPAKEPSTFERGFNVVKGLAKKPLADEQNKGAAKRVAEKAAKDEEDADLFTKGFSAVAEDATLKKRKGESDKGELTESLLAPSSVAGGGRKRRRTKKRKRNKTKKGRTSKKRRRTKKARRSRRTKRR